MKTWCETNGVSPTTELSRGMDFRRPEHRREVFLRFYEFHTRTNSHPGCVYYLMPYLAERFAWDAEAKLWYAFLNGNTQHPVSSWKIFEAFPELPRDMAAFRSWVEANYQKIAYDTDRRYHRTALVDAVDCYRKLVGNGTQQGMFEARCVGSERENFSPLWDFIRGKFYSFGRLSTFSYMEYLRLMGVPVECDRLFLEDMSGSKSHRNGLCLVSGLDHLDWHKSNKEFPGKQAYTPELLAWLADQAEQLLAEARRRMPGDPTVTLFTLESALCTYKGWHRKNRRYPNVYNDMFRDRINDSAARWGEPMTLWWDARRASLPRELRCEDVPADPGLNPAKQNHYRLTGEVIMMDERSGGWPCFANEFNAALWRSI